MDLRKNNQKLQELVKHLKDYGYNVDPYMLIMVSDFFKERCKEQLPIQLVSNTCEHPYNSLTEDKDGLYCLKCKKALRTI